MVQLKKMNEKKLFIILVITSIFILSIPLVIRTVFFDSYPLGYESYSSIARASQFFGGEEFIGMDVLFSQKSSVPDLYEFVLGIFSFFVDTRIIAVLLPYVLGIFSSILFYLILRSFPIKKESRFVTAIFFILSPAFFYTFSTSQGISLAFFLNLAGFFFLMKKKRIFFFISLLIYLVLPFTGVFNFLIALCSLFYLYLFKSRNKKILSIIIVSVSVAFLFYIPLLSLLGFPFLRIAFTRGIFSYFISDLGAKSGFGAFMVFLCAIGLYLSWKKKREYYFMYIFLFGLVILSLFNESLLVYLCIPVSFFSGIAFIELFNMKWDLPRIKDFSIIIIICGTLFSISSYSSYLIRDGPSLEEIESLEWLRIHFNNQDGAILSHPSNGFLIEAITGKPVVIDDDKGYFYENSQDINNSFSLFHSRNLDKSKSLLGMYNITHIWINEKMKSDIWGGKEDGLLFLFRNNETFKKIYNYTSIDIWKLTTNKPK